jgi:hypothetical protein
MPNELTRWLNGDTTVERRRSRELDAVEHATDVAEARVVGINQVTQRAMYETMRTQMLRREAERVAPDGAELYAMIALAGAVETTRVIEGMHGRRYGR